MIFLVISLIALARCLIVASGLVMKKSIKAISLLVKYRNPAATFGVIQPSVDKLQRGGTGNPRFENQEDTAS